MANSNFIMIVIGIIVLIAIIYFINRNDNQPIPNSGTISDGGTIPKTRRGDTSTMNKDYLDGIYSSNQTNPQTKTNSTDNLLSSDDGIASPKYSLLDYQSDDNNNNVEGNFTYKKQKFVKKSAQDIKDLFDVEKLKPQEYENWFDVVPQQSTKHIKGIHLIHPKEHLGISTTGSCKKGGTHDIRGQPQTKKTMVGPWNISTMESDPYAKGLCEFNN